LRGPKMMSAITRMMISSGMPMEPNILGTPAGRRASAVTTGLRLRINGDNPDSPESLQVLQWIIEIRSGRGQGNGL
jgi:hypothetical protein